MTPVLAHLHGVVILLLRGVYPLLGPLRLVLGRDVALCMGEWIAGDVAIYINTQA